MQIFNDVNKILNAKSTSIALFTVTGMSRMLSDYQNAQTKEDKKKALIQDTTILLGAATGILGYSKGSEYIITSNFAKNFSKQANTIFNTIKNESYIKLITSKIHPIAKKITKNFVSNISSTTKNCVDNALLVASGIGGAIASNYILEFGHKIKNKVNKKNNQENINNDNIQLQNITENNKQKKQTSFSKFKEKMLSDELTQIDNVVGADTRKNIVSNIVNLPEMKVFSSTVISSQSFEIAEEKTFKKKLKHTTKNIITGTMVPIFYLSIASNLTKGLHSTIRVPFSFASMILGTMFTNKKLENHMKNLNT